MPFQQSYCRSEQKINPATPSQHGSDKWDAMVPPPWEDAEEEDAEEDEEEEEEVVLTWPGPGSL